MRSRWNGVAIHLGTVRKLSGKTASLWVKPKEKQFKNKSKSGNAARGCI